MPNTGGFMCVAYVWVCPRWLPYFGWRGVAHRARVSGPQGSSGSFGVSSIKSAGSGYLEMMPWGEYEAWCVSRLSYRHGRTNEPCPQCSHKRKKMNQKKPCLTIYRKADKVDWTCHHCGWTGVWNDKGMGGKKRDKPSDTGSVPRRRSYGTVL